MNANQPRNEKTPIELATEAVMRDLNDAITHQHRAHRVDISEAEFRRILALYFERQTATEWMEILGAKKT
jgi:hypothetical protein